MICRDFVFDMKIWPAPYFNDFVFITSFIFLSIGFGQIFLEFNPVDIPGADPWIPAIAAVEEQVLLVR